MNMMMHQNSKKISSIFPDSIVVREGFDLEISGMSLDSRLIQPHYLFIAKTGYQQDGRQFIDDAIHKGASVVLSEGLEQGAFYLHESGCPVYCCENLVSVLGELASRFYESNQKNVRLIGVTGTNGKTSICHFLAQALSACGFRVALLGTAGNGFLEQLEESALTTLDVVSVHQKIADLTQQGAQIICMEVSSHSLVQGRVSGLHFETAVFSNLSRDHLDFHESMEAYEASKALLFKHESLKHAVLRLDEAGERIVQSIANNIHLSTLGEQHQSCSLQLPSSKLADAIDIAFDYQGEQCRIENRHLFGQFNIENMLLSFLCMTQSGVSSKQACAALEQVKPVTGRLQKIELQAVSASDMPQVLVDFAHTPEALEKVLQSVKAITRGKLILVFGCGGNRDKGKRPLMAKVAEQFSDCVFVTSDNPRNETQSEISQQIIVGFSEQFLANVFVEQDRALAIKQAIRLAGSNDVVLISGKGHEQYQLLGDKKIFFSDQLVAEQVLLAQAGSQ